MKRNFFLIILVLLIGLNMNVKISFAQNEETEFSVFLYDSKNSYMSLVKEELEKLAMESQEKIKLNFYDANNDINIQRNQLKIALEEETDVVLISLVDPYTSDEFITMVKEYNIPIEVFDREPMGLNCIKSYGKAIFIGNDLWNLANLQGEIIKKGIEEGRIKDINNNGYIDYIIISGDLEDKESIITSEGIINYLKRNNINTQMLDKEYGSFEREKSKGIMEGLLIRYLGNVDLIIANNDDMAIGAIEALQEVGYNKGNSDMYIPVVGIGGDREAIELIDQGFMEGTVLQEDKGLAKTLLNIGLNLEKGMHPLENMNYEFDDSGVSVRLKGSGIISRK